MDLRKQANAASQRAAVEPKIYKGGAKSAAFCRFGTISAIRVRQFFLYIDGMSAPVSPETKGTGQAEPVPAVASAPTAKGPARRRLMRQTELVDRIKAYDPDADEALLNKAYVYAMKAHGKQFRASGDPYFAHPLEVAAILTDLKLDVATIVTALLHDTIEDTLATYDDIKANFGEEIANLVDGVTKLSQLELFSERTKQAENFRKLMLAITERHSRAPGEARRPAAQHAHARSSSTIRRSAAASRRRRWTSTRRWPGASACSTCARNWKTLRLPNSIPKRAIPSSRGWRVSTTPRGDRIGRIADQIKRKLAEHGIDAWVYGRAKRAFSIWRKLKDKQLNFEQLSDIFGFRVIVKNEDDCYRALGVLHQNWQMVPSRFKDFISTPKHERLSFDPHHGDRAGKTACRSADPHPGDARRRRTRRRSALALSRTRRLGRRRRGPRLWLAARDGRSARARRQRRRSSSRHSRLNLYQDQVFCFTPKGDLISLPRGATPIDFAYTLHTDSAIRPWAPR